MKKLYWIILVGIIAVLATLFILLYFSCWGCGANPYTPVVSLESTKNKACFLFVTINDCENSNEITVEFDANENGEIGDSGDTLQVFVENYYGCTDIECVKQICGCP